MKIFNIKLNNIYQFKDFNMSLRNKQKIDNPYLSKENNNISTINANDVNIIIGTNASGKTTLGKCLNLAESLIKKLDIYNSVFNTGIIDGIAMIEIEFVIKNSEQKKDYIYRYHVEFTHDSLLKERLDYFILGKQSNGYHQDNYLNIYDYRNANKSGYNEKEIKSVLYNNYHYEGFLVNGEVIDDKTKAIIDLSSKFGFAFSYSGTSSYRANDLNFFKEDRHLLEKIEIFLKQIDSRVHSVTELKVEDSEIELQNENDFIIVFINGNKELVKNSDTSVLKNKMSSGTIEALDILLMFFNIKKGNYDTIFIDEQLNHIHTELEKELLVLLMSNLPEDCQLFYSTHNLDILKINIPINCFHIMFRKDHKYTSVLRPYDYFTTKNDRNLLYKKINEDYFNLDNDYDFGVLYDI